MQTMKVKPWSERQGDHVVINAKDFDADVHEPMAPVSAVADAGSQDILPAGESTIETGAQPARRGRKSKAE